MIEFFELTAEIVVKTNVSLLSKLGFVSLGQNIYLLPLISIALINAKEPPEYVIDYGCLIKKKCLG